ncbi:MAG: hypothetical protein WBM41_16130 [Arenicellales bacterium]
MIQGVLVTGTNGIELDVEPIAFYDRCFESLFARLRNFDLQPPIMRTDAGINAIWRSFIAMWVAHRIHFGIQDIV